MNVEDVPVTGRPGGGPAIFDLENFHDITIYTGVLPADKGFGLANVGGKINLNIMRPEDSLGITLKQSFGSSKFFRRTFLRINTGEHFNTRGFVSYSNFHADKWKGNGDMDRNNIMIGLTNTFKDIMTFEVFGIYSSMKLNTYRSLVYSQITDMDNNYKFDFSNDPNDYYYFDYNRNEFEDFMLLGNANINIGSNSKITLRPYFWSDNGYYLETITQPDKQNRIRRWDIDHNLFGGLAQFSSQFANLNCNLGYLYHNQQRPGPPSSWKIYHVESGKLAFNKYSLLSNDDSRYTLHAPFLTAKYHFNHLVFEGGIKYVKFELPSILTYKADSSWGDLSHEDALSRSPAVDEAASARDPKTLSSFFPHANLTGILSDNLTAHLSYGKNYVTHVDIYPYYMSQRSTFQKAGITFKQLWNSREMEISHNFEFGLRYMGDYLNIVPTAYYSTHDNKQAVLYDQALGATYPRNDASAAAYGAELETKITPIKNLSFYGSLSYNRFYFTQDINSDKDSSILHIKSVQVPDAPKYLAKFLLSYSFIGFTLSPILRYTSVRYGDVLHNQKVDPSIAFDIDVSYSHPLFMFKAVELSATFMNVLNRKNVALISTSDYKTLQTSYQPVAPFTVVGALTVKY